MMWFCNLFRGWPSYNSTTYHRNGLDVGLPTFSHSTLSCFKCCQ